MLVLNRPGGGRMLVLNISGGGRMLVLSRRAGNMRGWLLELLLACLLLACWVGCCWLLARLLFGLLARLLFGLPGVAVLLLAAVRPAWCGCLAVGCCQGGPYWCCCAQCGRLDHVLRFLHSYHFLHSPHRGSSPYVLLHPLICHKALTPQIKELAVVRSPVACNEQHTVLD